MRESLPIAVAQLDARPQELDGNVARGSAAAGEASVPLLLTPELSLTGYDLRDATATVACPLAAGEPLPGPFAALADISGHIVVGLVERGPDEVPYNALVLAERGRVRHVQRKLYLPTYGMFDEGRYFGRGERLQPVALPNGWLGGFLICEDFWHPGLAYVLAAAGADVICVAAAAPGRGVWQGGEHGDFASAEAWELIARTTAALYSVYVLLANRVGVEGGVSFAGGSLIVGPTGDVVARGSSHGPALLHATLDPAELARARRPAHHGRDDRPALVARELQRLGLAS
ncbi:MAG: carbon-nitrogen hydrolase [Gemmatimonadetes bacterium]|nr:carbon-nitrogen hydrolase [Gemmatimonadota bacterium]